ncbi:Mu transposase, partial [Corchorus olitorius]
MVRTLGGGSPRFPPSKTNPSQIGKKQIRSKVVALPSCKKLRFSDVKTLVPTDWNDELISGNDSFWVNLNEYKKHDATPEQYEYEYIRTEAK